MGEGVGTPPGEVRSANGKLTVPANVNKYYIAYRLGFEAEKRRLAAIESASN